MRRLIVVVVVAVLVPFAAAEDARPASCGVGPTGGLVTVALGTRSYQLYVPGDLAAGTSVPLLLSFHGLGGSGNSHASTSEWPAFADDEGFILALPNGNPLLAAPAGMWTWSEGSRDVQFARDIVADIQSRYCVDAAQIHATGHSNGAFFAQRLACDAADLFASVTEYAGGRPGLGTACTPSRPIAVGMFHGRDDVVVRMQQGEASRDEWVARLNCTDTAVEDLGDGEMQTSTGCDGGVEVLWREYAGQTHSWPAGDRNTEMQATMWDLFQRYPHP